MVALVSPSGVEVGVPEESVERLLRLGYTRADERPKPAPKRRAPRKAPKPDQK